MWKPPFPYFFQDRGISFKKKNEDYFENNILFISIIFVYFLKYIYIIFLPYLQVCSVLDSLEREYRRDDDTIQKHLTSNDIDRVTLITQLISKHQEQKEAFLKVIILSLMAEEEVMDRVLLITNRPLIFFKCIFIIYILGLHFSQKNCRNIPKILKSQSSIF